MISLLVEIIKLKNYTEQIQKQLNPSAAKHSENLNMNVGLIIKFPSDIMQGKKKSYECHTKFSFSSSSSSFFFFFSSGTN